MYRQVKEHLAIPVISNGNVVTIPGGYIWGFPHVMGGWKLGLGGSTSLSFFCGVLQAEISVIVQKFILSCQNHPFFTRNCQKAM